MECIYQAMQEGKYHESYQGLIEEQIDWCKREGLNLDKEKRVSYSEEEYREAYLLWKEQNPKKKSIGYKETVVLPNGKIIPLWNRISTMKTMYKVMQKEINNQSNHHLTEEQITW